MGQQAVQFRTALGTLQLRVGIFPRVHLCIGNAAAVGDGAEAEC